MVRKTKSVKKVSNEKNLPPAIPVNLKNKMKNKSGRGLENIGTEDLSIPFLLVCQSLSPQRKKSNAKYIEGCEEGSIFNTTTNKVYSEIVIVPIACQKVFIEWIPRDKGGGFVAAHEKGSKYLDACTVNGIKIKAPNGNDIIETIQMYVLVVDQKTKAVERAVIPFKSTQLKKARNILTICDERRLQDENGNYFQPPLYANMFLLQTSEESKDEYNWMGWTIQDMGVISEEYEEVFEIADAYASKIDSGSEKVDYSTLADDEPIVESSKKEDDENDDEVPY